MRWTDTTTMPTSGSSFIPPDFPPSRRIPVGSVSGGEYKLLYIIRNMLLKPQLLIMDEPDVFLDFENLIGLVHLINSYDGTVLTITHSRLLLSQLRQGPSHREHAAPGIRCLIRKYDRWLLET